TTWSFGTVGYGSIATFTGTIQNTGNAPASAALTGLAQPTIFGLASNPTVIAAGATTPLVGEFTPPSSNGVWSDRATLSVTAQALCAPLPAQWASSAIQLSGSSNGAPSVTASGTLDFPTTKCGAGAPSARTVTLTNATNVAYSFHATFNSGAFYAL